MEKGRRNAAANCTDDSKLPLKDLKSLTHLTQIKCKQSPFIEDVKHHLAQEQKEHPSSHALKSWKGKQAPYL